MISQRDAALVIIGHGSTLNPDSNTPSFQHARTIRESGNFREVACCFWKEEPSMREVLHMVESREIYLVPNFISEGYFTRTVIPRELELDGPRSERNGRVLNYCEPVGSHPKMTEVLLHRAGETAPGVPTSETTLFIVGHGTGLNDNSAKAAKDQVKAIEALGLYGEVLAAYMEEPPLISDWATLSSCPNVVVVPFFISDGLHSYEDIPVLLGVAEEGKTKAVSASREVFEQNPYSMHGKQLYYASAIGTEPLFAEVILDQVEAFDRLHGLVPL
jgi:sirohydrochlorin cobaltochelatase